MLTVWTKHLKDQEDKDRFEKSINSSKWLLDHLNEIILDIDRSKSKAEISPKNYDQPNWEHRQAHMNGYRQCLRDMQTIINLDQKENNDPRQFIPD